MPLFLHPKNRRRHFLCMAALWVQLQMQLLIEILAAIMVLQRVKRKVWAHQTKKRFHSIHCRPSPGIFTCCLLREEEDDKCTFSCLRCAGQA